MSLRAPSAVSRLRSGDRGSHGRNWRWCYLKKKKKTRRLVWDGALSPPGPGVCTKARHTMWQIRFFHRSNVALDVDANGEARETVHDHRCQHDAQIPLGVFVNVDVWLHSVAAVREQQCQAFFFRLQSWRTGRLEAPCLEIVMQRWSNARFCDIDNELPRRNMHRVCCGTSLTALAIAPKTFSIRRRFSASRMVWRRPLHVFVFATVFEVLRREVTCETSS